MCINCFRKLCNKWYFVIFGKKLICDYKYFVICFDVGNNFLIII